MVCFASTASNFFLLAKSALSIIIRESDKLMVQDYLTLDCKCQITYSIVEHLQDTNTNINQEG